MPYFTPNKTQRKWMAAQAHIMSSDKQIVRLLSRF